MPTRKRAVLFAAVVGLSFTAFAEEPAKSAKPTQGGAAATQDADNSRLAKRPPKPKTATAKVGEACKTSDDCAGDLICGKGKCEQDLRDAHPAT